MRADVNAGLFDPFYPVHPVVLFCCSPRTACFLPVALCTKGLFQPVILSILSH